MAETYVTLSSLKHYDEKIKEVIDEKQDQLVGEEGQVVSFDAYGNVIAVNFEGGVTVSKEENNQIETKDDGIYVAPTDLSNYYTKTDIGDITNLSTTEKEVVSSINEIKELVDSNYTELTTTNEEIATSLTKDFNWKEIRTLDNTFTCLSIRMCLNQLVAVGSGNAQIYINTGYNSWSSVKLYDTSYNDIDMPSVKDIACNDDVFVVIGESGGLCYSTNKTTTWTRVTSLDSATFTSIIYANGMFVAVGLGGIIYQSTDGMTFTQIDSGISVDLHCITYADNMFVVGGSKAFYKSTDTTTWTLMGATIQGFTAYSISYGNDRFIAVGSGGKKVYYFNGSRWINASGISTASSIIPSCVTYASDRFITICTSGKTYYSTDGKNFISASEDIISADYQSIIYDDNKSRVITIGNDCKIYSIELGLEDVGVSLKDLRDRVSTLETNNTVTIDDILSKDSTNSVQNKVIYEALEQKVDKIDGKGLSTNDLTDELLETIETGDAKTVNGHTVESNVPENAKFTDTVTTVTTTGSGNAITSISSTDGVVTATKGSTFLTAHPTISKSTDTTSTATATHGGTITMVDSVTRDGNGHVTKINTKTVTLPSDADTKYTHPTTSGNKHIPSGGSSGQILRWSADGTAVWGADNNTTYSAATQSANGLMSSADKKKLDGIATGANAYTLPTATSSALGGVKIGYTESGKNYPVELNDSGQMYVNVPWTDNNTTYGVVSTTANGLAPKRDGSTTKYLRADGTWATPPDNNTTYSNMTAATSSAAGKAGLVPAPAAGAQAKFLRGDGTWQTPTNTTYSNFVKSGSGAKAGLVPAPSTTAGTTKYLREDGTWAVPPDTNTTYTHPTSGVTAGTYRSVTVNAQGHVTSGTNPTITLAQGGTGGTDASTARTNLGVPPTSHASTATTYGKGSSSNYGHLKINDSYSSTPSTSYNASNGVAASLYAVQNCYKNLSDKCTTLGKRIGVLDDNYVLAGTMTFGVGTQNVMVSTIISKNEVVYSLPFTTSYNSGARYFMTSTTCTYYYKFVRSSTGYTMNLIDGAVAPTSSTDPSYSGVMKSTYVVNNKDDLDTVGFGSLTFKPGVYYYGACSSPTTANRGGTLYLYSKVTN